MSIGFLDDVRDGIDVFEVAFSSLQTDRRTKNRLYATAGIPTYVIFNLQDQMIEVFSNPSPVDGKYRSSFEQSSREVVTLELSEFGQLVLPGGSVL